MQNAKFGKRMYASAAGDRDNGDPGGSRTGNLGGQARLEGVNLQREAAKKKVFLPTKNGFTRKKKSFR